VKHGPRSAVLAIVGLLGLTVLGTFSCTGGQATEPFGAFFRFCGQKAAVARRDGAMTVPGLDGWLFLGAELRSVSVGEFWGGRAQTACRAARADRRDPLPAILDFRAGLARVGIELLLVPVPPKVLVYPDKLDPAFPGAQARTPQPPPLDAVLRRFYGALRQHGVQVLDLYPLFWKERAGPDGPVYCLSDTHWSGRGCVLASEVVADWVRRRPWFRKGAAARWQRRKREVRIRGDLRRADAGAELLDESLPLWFVADEKGTPPEPDRGAPILLLGDSHVLVFHSGGDMYARGAGLADQLAFEFRFPVDLLGVRGSGATPARISLYRRARADAAYLKTKKLVVWCFAAREFTEAVSGWRKVPVPR